MSQVPLGVGLDSVICSKTSGGLVQSLKGASVLKAKRFG